MKHPIQNLKPDASGVVRFTENKIVSFLLENGGYDMNAIARMSFDKEDRQQFAQLIGYSLSGYGELQSYVTDEAYEAAEKTLETDGVLEAENSTLQEILTDARSGMRAGVARLYGIHPDDLGEQ